MKLYRSSIEPPARRVVFAGTPDRLLRSIYKPSRRLGKIAKGVNSLQQMANLRREVSTGVLDAAVSAIEQRAGEIQGLYAFASTAEGRWLGSAQTREGYVFFKVGGAGDLAIQREAENLVELSSGFADLLAPKIISLTRTPSSITLVTSFHRHVGRIEVPHVIGLARSLHKARLVHGDFASWNLIPLGSEKCMAIDWESATHDYLFGYDVVHYAVRQLMLVHRLQPIVAAKRLTEPTGLIGRYIEVMAEDLEMVVEASPSDVVRSYIDRQTDQRSTLSEVELRYLNELGSAIRS